jgi:hypothetical protein
MTLTVNASAKQELCQPLPGSAALAVLMVFVASVAHAQSSASPTENMFSSPNGGIFADPDALSKRHKGPTGKPCMTLEGSARPEKINSNIIEHWVSAANSCGQLIKLKICYYRTEHCVMVEVPPWDRKDTVLGIFPALKDFRYEYTEQFY